MAAFDHAGADGQTQGQRAGVVQAVQVVAQVALGVAHRGFGIQGGLRFQMFRQTGQHLGHRPAFEAFLLGAPPLNWLGRAVGGGGGGQRFADVKVVAEKSGLGAEDFRALQADPIRPIAHRVNLTVQSPAGLSRAMAPTASGGCHAAEGGPIYTVVALSWACAATKRISFHSRGRFPFLAPGCTVQIIVPSVCAMPWGLPAAGSTRNGWPYTNYVNRVV